MKDKINVKNKTKFDYTARKLGIVGAALIILSIAFGLPLMKMMQNYSHNAMNDIQNVERKVSNLQVQLDDGTVTNN